MCIGVGAIATVRRNQSLIAVYIKCGRLRAVGGARYVEGAL